MNRGHISSLLLLLVVALSACGSTGVTTEMVSSTPEPTTPIATPMPTDTQALTSTPPPSPTSVSPTVTFTQAPTLTPLPTLKPEQAEETMSTLLQEPVDCSSPCFSGIVPGQTTLGEVSDIFTHLGLQLEQTNTNVNEDFYAVVYDFDSGLSITVILAIQDQIIENLRIKLTPEKSQPGVPREWLAYSPETLISRYGPPSKAVFGVGGAAPTPGYTMVLYFDTVDLIIEYDGYEYTFDGYVFKICPLTNQWEGVRIWMGENPYNPPPSFLVPLQDATTLTMEEFSSIMTGDPENACIELIKEAVQNP